MSDPIQSAISIVRAENAELLDVVERCEMWLSTAPDGRAMQLVCQAVITKAKASREADNARMAETLRQSMPVAVEAAPPVPESITRDLASHRGPRFFREESTGMTWEWRNGKMTTDGEDSIFHSPSELLAEAHVVETDESGNALELSADDIAAERADRDNQAEADLS